MVGDRETAGFSCARCKMNARMSGQSLKYWGKKAVGRSDEVYMNMNCILDK